MSSAEQALRPGQAADALPPAARYSKSYRAWLLFILLLVNALNLADRQGMAATMPAFRADLQLTGAQVGLIQGFGFALFYTLFGLPMAWMSERWRRTRIIAVSVGVFGAMVAACGTAASFVQFMLFRVGVGIGDAGFGPPVASVIGDHYPPQRRASAMTIIWLGAPIGAVAGAVLAGWIAQTYNWRTWFYVLAAPAIAVGVLAFLTLREPVRGMSDPVALKGPQPKMWTTFRFLLAKPSFRHILIGAGLAATGMNGVGQFLSSFLVSNLHVGFAEAGRLLGLMAGVAMASGLSLGGFGVDWAGKFDRRWYVWGPAIGLVIATPLFFFGVSIASVPTLVAVLALGHVALFVYYTPTLAMAQNMVGASMRASSAFVASLVLGLVGIGLGPTLMGFLIDFFCQRSFALGEFNAMCPGGAPPHGASEALTTACKAATAIGIRHSIMAVSLLFAWASLHFVLASRHLRQDLDTHYTPPVEA